MQRRIAKDHVDRKRSALLHLILGESLAMICANLSGQAAVEWQFSIQSAKELPMS